MKAGDFMSAISYFLTAAIFSFTIALPVGSGSVMMIRNGLNKHYSHAFWTGLGMNPTDCVMMFLYYIGLSKVFQIYGVQLILYIIGILLLLKLSVECFKKKNVKVEGDSDERHSAFDSFKDGVAVSLIPSSLITWCALYGSFLSTQPNFGIACLGILVGFTFNNLAYMGIAFVISKFANQKIIRYINVGSGIFLLGFAFYFAYQLFLLIFR